MLEFGNKEWRNLQEQVRKNQLDILELKQGGAGHEPVPGPEGPRGEQGNEGPKGPKGNSIYGVGTNLPPSDMFEYGDFYLLNDGRVYKNVNGYWTLQCNLRGPQGLRGPDGTAVVANPIEEATDDVVKLKIDGIVYTVRAFTAQEKQLLTRLLEFTEITADGDVTFGRHVQIDGGLDVNYNLNVHSDVTIDGELDADTNVVVGQDLRLKNTSKVIFENDGVEYESSLNEELSGKVNTDDVRQNITPDSSSDSKYIPSMGLLKNQIAGLNARIDGQAKSYSLYYSESPYSSDEYWKYRKVNGDYFSSLTELNNYVSGLTLKNNLFDYSSPQQSGSIAFQNGYLITRELVILRVNNTADYSTNDLKDGDVIHVIEQKNSAGKKIPEFWASGDQEIEFFPFDSEAEGSLENVAYKNEVNEFTDDNYFTESVSIGEMLMMKSPADIQFTTPGQSLGSMLTEKISVEEAFVLDDNNTVPGNNTFTGDNTFTGTNTFENGINIKNQNHNRVHSLFVNTGGTLNYQQDGANKIQFLTGSMNLGQNYNLNVGNNKITDGTNEITPAGLRGIITIPAPESTTLTDEEYAILTSGKAIKIDGTFSSLKNMIIYPPYSYGSDFRGLYIAQNYFGCYVITSSNKKFSTIASDTKTWHLYNLSSLNGKTVPTYPSNTGTFVLKCVNGVLTWVEE